MDAPTPSEVTLKTLDRPSRSALQYYVAKAKKKRRGAPPMLFVHGAFCDGWIWGQQFQPFLAANGFDSYAIDLRGRKASPYMPTTHGLSDYAADVDDLITHIGRKPILVGHSLGGMVAQKVSAVTRPHALALMASVPPEGMSMAAWQLALTNPFLFWNTATFAMSPAFRSTAMARDTLFSSDAPDHVASMVLRRSTPEGPRALMEAQLPLPYPPGYLSGLDIAVFGAADDKLVPVDAVRRTAAYHGVEPIIFPDMAHALMVDTRWELAARHLLNWALEVI